MNWSADSQQIKAEDGGNGHAYPPNPSAPHQARPADQGKGFAVRVRGIPFQESEFTVYQWLNERGINVRNGPLGVQFQYTGRQWSGDAYVALESARDIDTCLQHNNAKMNTRYLEFFPTTYYEMETQLKGTGLYRFPNEYNIRLRGLEYKCSKEMIAGFFPGLDIAAGLDGIILCANEEGRATGEGFVLFENKSSVVQAIQKHKEKMGERYIEIFLASAAQILEMSGSARRAGTAEREFGRSYPEQSGGYRPDAPYAAPPGTYPPEHAAPGYGKYPPAGGWGEEPARGNRSSEPRYAPPPLGQHRLYMRGLPWKCTEVEIQQFFSPTPVRSVTKNLTPSGVFDGSAWVEFPTADAMNEGKKKDRSNMGHRYVELFSPSEYESVQSRSSRGGRGGGADRGGRKRSRSRERSYGRGGGPGYGGGYDGGYQGAPPAGYPPEAPRGDPYHGGYSHGYAAAPAQGPYNQYSPGAAAYGAPGGNNGWTA